jgi:hypothetical protein
MNDHAECRTQLNRSVSRLSKGAASRIEETTEAQRGERWSNTRDERL